MTPPPAVVMVPAGRRSPALVIIGFLALAAAYWLGFIVHGPKEPVPKDRIQVPCTIDHFEIRDDVQASRPFRADLSFHYRWRDHDHTSTRLWIDGSDEDEVEPLTAAGRELSQGAEGNVEELSGSIATCWLDPAQPDDAFLLASPSPVWRRVGTSVGAVTLVIYGALAISAGLRRGQGSGIGGALGSVFFFAFAFAGLAATWGLALAPGAALRQSSWQTAPATVLWSRLDHSQAEARMSIYYEYRWNDRVYRGSRYSAEGEIPVEKKAEDFVSTHPAGSALQVFVNPRDPEEVTLSHSTVPGGLFIASFSLVFVAVGVASMAGALSRPKPRLPSDPQDSGGPWLASGVAQRIRCGSLGEAILTGAIALWMASFCVLGLIVIPWQGMIPGLLIFVTVLSSMSAAIGIGAWHAFRAYRGPSWELTLSRTPLGPGDAAMVKWRLIPGLWQPTSFSVLVQVQYEIRHRSKKEGVRYAYPELAAVEVVEKTLDPAVMAAGEAEFLLPENLYATLPDPKTPLRGQLKIIYYGSGKKIFEQAGAFRLIPPG